MERITFTNRFEFKRYFLWIFSAAFVASQVYSALQMQISNASLLRLEEELKKAMTRNEELKNELIMSSSLIKLSDKAQNLGFKKVERTIYLKQDEEFARLP